MPKWHVTLNGDPWDLKTLTGLAVGVAEEGHTFVLRSPDFDGLTDAGAVQQLAIELVEVLNGLGRMKDGNLQPVTAGGVIGDNGDGMISLFVGDGLSVADRAGAAISDSATGEPIPVPPSPDFAKWAAIAQREPNVRRALRFFAAPVTPVNLWKVYEVIRDDVGGKGQIVSYGWTTADQIERFRSVHSVSAFGDEARHAVEMQPPPRDPMSLGEAQAFVRGLLERWLASK